jgi:hypothetical protein
MDEHGVCSYDLVGVDSKTFVPFVLFYFIYVFFYSPKSNLFF